MTSILPDPKAAPRFALALRRRLLAIATTSSLVAMSYACSGDDSETTAFLPSPNLQGGAGGTNGSSSATCRASGIPTLADGIKTYEEGFTSYKKARDACPAECGVVQYFIAYSCSKAWDGTTYSCNCMGPFCTENQGKAACGEAASPSGYKARAVNVYVGSGTEVDAPGWYCVLDESRDHNCGRPCYVNGVALLAPLVGRRDWGAA